MIWSLVGLTVVHVAASRVFGRLGQRRASPRARWGSRWGYDITTVIVGVVMLAILRPEVDLHPIALLMASAVGILLPLAARRFIGHATRWVVLGGGPLRAGWTVLVAGAEEVIWRLGVPMVLMGLGVNPWPALLLAALGFLGLHVLSFGLRVLGYLSLFTIVTVVCFALFGLAASVCFHGAHNLTLELSASQPRPRGGDASPVPPPSSTW